MPLVAWAWWVGDCKFPSLLTDWNGGTTAEGTVVKSALLGYDDPPATPASDGGAADAGGDAETGADAGGSADADTSG